MCRYINRSCWKVERLEWYGPVGCSWSGLALLKIIKTTDKNESSVENGYDWQRLNTTHGWGSKHCVGVNSFKFLITPLAHARLQILFCRPPSLCRWHPALQILLPRLCFHLARTATQFGKPNLPTYVIQPPFSQLFQNRIHINLRATKGGTHPLKVF